MEQKKSCECHTQFPAHVRAIWALLRVMKRHHACMERRLADQNIHHCQYRMLSQLSRHQEDTLSQKELAEKLGISPSAVATALKRIEKEEFVTRSATDEDNRRNEIHITEKGQAKIRECHGIFEAIDRATFEGFTEEELATLISFLERIDRNLDAAGAPTDLR